MNYKDDELGVMIIFERIIIQVFYDIDFFRIQVTTIIQHYPFLKSIKNFHKFLKN